MAARGFELTALVNDDEQAPERGCIDRDELSMLSSHFGPECDGHDRFAN